MPRCHGKDEVSLRTAAAPNNAARGSNSQVVHVCGRDVGAPQQRVRRRAEGEAGAEGQEEREGGTAPRAGGAEGIAHGAVGRVERGWRCAPGGGEEPRDGGGGRGRTARPLLGQASVRRQGAAGRSFVVLVVVLVMVMAIRSDSD